MERTVHDMSNLFAQLGQPNDEVAIARFIETYRPMGGSVMLHEATFWSPSQSNFLREALLEDADWADVVDELNLDLHARH